MNDVARPSSRLVVGTAGHVDHGKTTLVRALTGVETDRLPEEKARGISIELGFAPLTLPDGRQAALVDVPGHEKFVRAMVAGATGVDLVLLVVAADEGVMPQTREHLDICALLGMRRGLVALTKIDLVDPELRALALSDVRDALAGSFLDGAPIVPCSAVGGQGLEDLRAALARATVDLPPRSAEGPARLPVDRLFTVKGFGAVVTGTIASGRFATGDAVVVLPGGGSGRVRSIEEHGEKREQALAGERAALNVPGFDRGALARGGTIARAGELEESACVDAELHWLGICPAPLGRRTRFLFHALTTQEDVAVQLLDRVPLPPGGQAPVRLHLGRAVALLPGDRFVLRGFRALPGHGTVVGGGKVVRVAVTPRRRLEPGAGELVRAMAAATAVERVFLEVQAAASDGLPRPALAGRIGLASGAAEAALAALVAAGRLVVLGAEPGHLMTSEASARLESAVLERLDKFHAATPLAPGISRAALRTSTPRVARLEPRAFGGIVDRLAVRGAVQGEADLVRRAGFSSGAAESSRATLVDRVAAALGQGALAPPTPQELAGALGASPAAINESLAILCRRGSVLRIKSDLYFDRDAVASLRQRLLAFLRAHHQITPQEWKALVGSTRKFTIPLAEHFDAEKVTFRVGEVRRPRIVPGAGS